MAKYFHEGYVTFGGDVLLKLTDISLSYSVDTDEVSTFDSFPHKDYEAAADGWTVSCSGVFESGTTEPSKFSGETRVSGATSGAEILESIKGRAKGNFVLKIMTGLYETGQVILTSYELTGALGSKITFSLSLQGCGALTKAAS